MSLRYPRCEHSRRRAARPVRGRNRCTLRAGIAAATEGPTRRRRRTPPAASRRSRADLFYRLLLGDVALQRGDVHAGRARVSSTRRAIPRDARLARRATEIAIASRQRSLVQDAAKLWAQLDPAAERPKRVLAALAAGHDEGRAFRAARRTTSCVRASSACWPMPRCRDPGVGEVFLQLNRLFSQQSDKRAVLALIRDVAKPYPKTPEAHFAVALAAFGAGDDMATASEATAEVDRALELRPDWDRAAILKGEILAREIAGRGDPGAGAVRAAHPARRARPARSRSITSTRSASSKRAR